ncbi:hypothetical protein Peur_065771 [Populus x canadensis]
MGSSLRRFVFQAKRSMMLELIHVLKSTRLLFVSHDGRAIYIALDGELPLVPLSHLPLHWSRNTRVTSLGSFLLGVIHGIVVSLFRLYIENGMSQGSLI